jgi:hypothetical protein
MGKRDSGARVSRSSRTRDLKRQHFVFCEGKTEKVFLEQIRQFHRMSSVQVSVVGQVGDPSAVVRAAKEKLTELRRNSRTRVPGEFLVYAVFDRDEHSHFSSACEEARVSSIVLGVSNPCVEIWFVWMVEDYNRSDHRSVVQKRCSHLHPGYHHDRSLFVNYDNRTSKLASEANARALRVATLHSVSQDEPFPNPSSTFGTVVDSILRDR